MESLTLVWVSPFQQNWQKTIFFSQRRVTNLFCPNTVHENKYVDDQKIMVEPSTVHISSLCHVTILSYYICFMSFIVHTHGLYISLCCSKCYITQFTGKSSLSSFISSCKNFIISLFEFILTKVKKSFVCRCGCHGSRTLVQHVILQV